MENRHHAFCSRCSGPLEVRWVPDEERERPVCRACGFIVYMNPKVVVGAIPVQDGRVLLLRRRIDPARGKWTFPAGYVELGESLEEATRRETQEEVSLEIGELSLLNVYSYRESPVVTVVYLSPIVGGKPQPGMEAEEVAFFAPAELPWGELAFRSTREALEDWVRGLGSPGHSQGRS